ncbi:MAG: Yip1 family protein [Haloferacaceae archaeon]
MAPWSPVIRPSLAFDDDPSMEPALAVVAVAGLVSVLSLLLLGAAVVRTLPAGATVENPDRPAAELCNDPIVGSVTVDGRTVAFDTPEGCAEPKRVPASRVVWRAFGSRLPGQFLGTVVGWLVVGGALHLLTREEGDSARGPMAVAAWGTVPGAVGSVVTSVLVASAVVAGDGPRATTLEATVRGVEGALRAGVPAAVGVSAVTTVWSAWIHYHGLRAVRDLDRDRAAMAVGIVAVAGFLLALWGALSPG